jgi:hypothetical protein
VVDGRRDRHSGQDLAHDGPFAVAGFRRLQARGGLSQDHCCQNQFIHAVPFVRNYIV